MDERTRDLVPSAVGKAGDPGLASPLALIVAHSPDSTQRDALIPLDRPLTIGRRDSGAVDVALDDGRVSRRHAKVRPRTDRSGADVEDLASRNGLFVDRVKTTSAYAKVGSVLRVGDTIFILSHAPGRQPQRRPAGVVGRSALVLDLLFTCASYAPSELPILLLGETGTGKEVFAAAIHELSARTGPLVTLNCAAIPRELGESLLFGHLKGAFTGATSAQAGAFAQAQAGTLFLDEVGELSPDVQAKLLRALENREFTPIGRTTPQKTDARIVAATNVDLRRASETGGFRRDLYARLAGGVLRLPPLRQRREDVPVLTRHFLSQLSSDAPIPWSANFAELLVAHSWPMNARELRLTLQRLMLLSSGQPELRGSDLLAVLDLPDDEAGADSAGDDEQNEGDVPARAELEALLATHHGNVSAIAKHYRRDRKQVYRWLRRYDLSLDTYR
jgi:DNA-binding NtrC family response regulator